MIYWISLTCISLWMFFMESTSTLNKKLTFEEGSCDGPFTLTPQENLTITHITSTTTSVFCQDISFSGWDSINSKQREVCVKLIKNQLDCSQRLEYRVRDYDASPSKLYDCKASSGRTPVYCTFDTLYIRVNSDGLEKKTSRVTYTVYSGREEQITDYTSSSSSSSSSHVAIIIGVLGLFVAILVPVICIRLKKARDRQNQDRVVTYRRNQQPRIKVVHHYHHVDNDGNQDALPGSELNKAPQSYNMPARSSNLFVGYPPSSAPIGYQFSPRPHIISPHTSLSVEQQATVTCEPPSYEALLKQK